MATAYAHATKATSALTQSSAATATLPGMAGVTCYLQKILVFSGPSLLDLNADLTLAGLDAHASIPIPMSQLLVDARTIDIDFNHPNIVGMPASDVNTDISLSIPALTGGAETTILLVGEYI
jgi:hypothetical protein